MRTFMRRQRLAALIWWGGLPHRKPWAWMCAWRIAGQELGVRGSKPLRPIRGETPERK